MPKWIINRETEQIFEIADNIPVPNGFELIQPTSPKKSVSNSTEPNVIFSDGDIPIAEKPSFKKKSK